MNEMNIRTSLSSVDPRDERIYELEDRIEELQLELDQKNIIIKQKDAVSLNSTLILKHNFLRRSESFFDR